MHIASLSYGKDSLKMLEVINSRGLPLDRIITFDVWATDDISADLPDVVEFKAYIDSYIKKKYDLDVEHLCAHYSNGEKVTYEKEFYRTLSKGKRAGEIYGFPYRQGAWCNSRLKLSARKGAILSNDIEYIGIAFDEISRQKRLNNKLVAPLVDFCIEEDLCGLYCTWENILSPTYNYSFRDGCWFCHNQSIGSLRNLWKNYPDLWQLLLKWETDSPVSFFMNGRKLLDFDYRFQLEDDNFRCMNSKSFRWDCDCFQKVMEGFA